MATTPSQFRLDAETLADLDRIAKTLPIPPGKKRPNRSEAIRVATRLYVRLKKLGGKSDKNS